METNQIPWAKPHKSFRSHVQIHRFLKGITLFIILLLLWALEPPFLERLDDDAANIIQSVWLLVVLSLICFMLVITICWWLLKHFWKEMGMVSTKALVVQFKQLTVWQQIMIYWATYALMAFTAVGCLLAIC